MAYGDVAVVPVRPADRRLIRGFIEAGEKPYVGEARKVPASRGEQAAILGGKAAFYRRGESASFLAFRGGEAVARLTVYQDRRYNEYHHSAEARFCWFECRDDDPGVAKALFGVALGWARSRGLLELRGPYAIAGLEGAGLLVEGFDRPQSMTMSAWNPPWYPALVEGGGFQPWKDLLSAELLTGEFRLPEKVERVDRLIRARGRFSILPLTSLRALLRMASELGALYERSFSEHDDFMPLDPRDFVDLARGLALLTEPGLVKIIAYDEKPVGFLFGFPDLSAALRRAGGRLLPWNLLDLALEKTRARRLIVNGAGVDPDRQRLGGTALLYSELERVVRLRGFVSVEMVQIAAGNTPMIREMELLGARVTKRHRIYRRSLTDPLS
jgi:GNAT superfamily N-acetyltransferase